MKLFRLSLASILTLVAFMCSTASGQEQKPAPATGEKPLVKLNTTMGDIIIELNPQAAPLTVENFLSYVDKDFYKGTTFHRVLPNHLIQGGGYLADNTLKQPDPPIKNESSKLLRHSRGTVAMARSTTSPDTATSQFFINITENPSLDADPAGAGHAIFGKVVAGMKVVDAIRQVPIGPGGFGETSRPVNPVIILSAKRISAEEARPQIAAEPADAMTSPVATTPPTPAVPTPTVTPENVPQVAHVMLTTGKGNIVLELDGAKAPISVANFLSYVDAGFYDQTIFHRVMDGFMIQGGGFDGNMTQKQTMAPIKNEWQNGLKNVRGSVAMARLGGQADSGSSQFFINVVDNAALDAPRDGAGYAVFGKVVAGMSTVDAIRTVQTTTRGQHANVPVEPVYITKAIRLDPAAAQKFIDMEKAGGN